MPTTYSPSLRLSLPGDGEQAGTWGQTTNTNLGTLIEAALSGKTQVSVTTANVTLTANNGSDDQSRHMVIELTGASTGARDVIIPASEKLYIVWNNTTGGYAHTVKVSGQSGVSVAANEKKILYCDGTTTVEAVNAVSTLLPLAGGTMTGALAIPDGAVGTPSLRFSSDTDTGLFWNSSGSFSGASNGVSVLTVNSSGLTTTGLTASGASTLTGAVSMGSTLAVTGASTFTGVATFNGGATIGDNSSDALTVNATTTFVGGVSFNGVPTFYGNVTIGDSTADTLTVVATSNFTGPVSMSGTKTMSGTTIFSGACTFSSTVTMSGATTFSGAVSCSSTSSFTGTATFNGAAAFNGAVTLGDTTGDAITITGTATVGSGTSLLKQSAGSFISHGSSSHASGVITVSASTPSGGSDGDIWFQI